MTQSKKEMSDQHQARNTKDNHWQMIFSDVSSRLTNHFPRAGSSCLDSVIMPLLSNPLLSKIAKQVNRRIMRRIKSFRRILVISDIHIGDGVFLQSVLTGVRDFFPDAQVDYLVSKAVFPLIAGNPEATIIYPIFFGAGPYPPAESLKALRELYFKEKYDLCLNLCPFIRNSDIAPGGRDVLNFKTHAPTLLRNERKPGPINHFSYQNYRFTRDWLSLVATPVRAESFKGVRLTLSDSAVEKGKSFVATVGLASNQPVILYNPDTASRFTLMPFDRQVEFLLRLTRFPVSILLGEGHTEAGIGVRLKATLPASLQEKVSIVPAALPLDAYAALIDRSDVFISGDTGPLHIAAAVTLGSVSSDIIYGGIALFGLAPLLQLPGVMAGFNALGAVLLCGLAYWTIRQSRQPHELRLEEATLNDQRWAFVTGFSLAASNPPMILSWLYGATLARHLGLAIPFSSGQKLLFIAGGALGLAGYQLLLALILKRMQHFIPAKVLRRIYFWLGIVLFLLSFFFIYNAQRLFFSKPQGGG